MPVGLPALLLALQWTVIASLAMAECGTAAARAQEHAATPTGGPVRRSLPASSRGDRLVVGVAQRNLPGYRVNLQIHLLARAVFREVRVTLASPNPELAVPSGCTFTVLRPPSPMARKRFATPLPVVPLCSLVLSARKPGTYPLDVCVLDSRGKFLAPPNFVWVRILSPHDAERRP